MAVKYLVFVCIMIESFWALSKLATCMIVFQRCIPLVKNIKMLHPVINVQPCYLFVVQAHKAKVSTFSYAVLICCK